MFIAMSVYKKCTYSGRSVTENKKKLQVAGPLHVNHTKGCTYSQVIGSTVSTVTGWKRIHLPNRGTLGITNHLLTSRNILVPPNVTYILTFYTTVDCVGYILIMHYLNTFPPHFRCNENKSVTASQSYRKKVPSLNHFGGGNHLDLK